MNLGFIADKLIQQYIPLKVMFRHVQMLSILENEVLAVRLEPMDVTIIEKLQHLNQQSYQEKRYKLINVFFKIKAGLKEVKEAMRLKPSHLCNLHKCSF